jgi:hypothetical protein
LCSTEESIEVSFQGLRNNVKKVLDKINKILSKIDVKAISFQFDKALFFALKRQTPQLEKTWNGKIFLSKQPDTNQIHVIVVAEKESSDQLIKQLEAINIVEESIPIDNPQVFQKLFSDIVVQKKKEYQQKWRVTIYLDNDKKTSTFHCLFPSTFYLYCCKNIDSTYLFCSYNSRKYRRCCLSQRST